MMAESHDGTIDMKSCCNNKTVHIQSDQDQAIQSFEFEMSQQFLSAYVGAFFYIDGFEKESSSFALYKPPLISRDIPVLTQSFLL